MHDTFASDYVISLYINIDISCAIKLPYASATAAAYLYVYVQNGRICTYFDDDDFEVLMSATFAIFDGFTFQKRYCDIVLTASFSEDY